MCAVLLNGMPIAPLRLPNAQFQHKTKALAAKHTRLSCE
jgi:hypothetical protein